MKRLLSILILTIFCSVLSIRANTIQGRVVEIHDGKTMTVENTGRQIKVALKLAAPPETDQPFADIARVHLSGLVLNRQVRVEYTGLGAGAILMGRVFCDDRDIGLQMIRDGVAWFDRSYESELTESERQTYANSEQAARNEHRGIWQDPSPVAPWEWRQANAVGANKAAIPYSSPAVKPATTDKTSSAKTSEGYAKSSSSHKAATPTWPIFSPSGNLFSVHMPGNGHDFAVEVEVENGRSVKMNFYWVNHLRIRYLVAWASGPYLNQTLQKLFDRTVDALNEASASEELPCEFYQEKDIPMSGYTGRRYKVRDCYFNGAIRNYFKVEGKTLKVFFVAVMSEIPDDPAIKEFLDSFVINN